MSRRCKCGCRAELPPAAKCTEYYSKAGYVDIGHKSAHDLVKMDRAAEKKRKSKEKAARVKHKEDKERVMTRTEWYDKLQTLVNQWILHVRDAGGPCCTCGKTTQGIKYDAGHCISRGSSPELRFEITNIHKQCSVNCNQWGSGMRPEYNEFIINKYGQDHYEWLIGPHKTLKDTFPHYMDIKAEIARYRKLIRAAGLNPYV